MSDDMKRLLSFVDGAKTGLDVMHSTRGGNHTEDDFWRGYRYALDSIGNYIDEIESEQIEGSL